MEYLVYDPDTKSSWVYNDNPVKLWIDDVRPAPEGYIWVKSVHEATLYCCQRLSPEKVLNITEISLDHDAGDYASMGGDYIKFMEWLEYKAIVKNWDISNVRFHFHTANPVGRANMNLIAAINGWKVIP